MSLSQTSEIAIHIVFSSHFSAFREVIDFLKPGHCLVDLALDVAAGPNQTPLLFSVCSLSEPIVFECVPDQGD